MSQNESELVLNTQFYPKEHIVALAKNFNVSVSDETNGKIRIIFDTTKENAHLEFANLLLQMKNG